jgi:cytoskeletal protein RodZ
VSEATRIPVDKLEAIEADDFSGFPSMAYGRGFLLIYGKFLRVDVSEQAHLMEGHNAIHTRDYQYLHNTPVKPLSEDSVAPRERSPSVVPLLVFLGILALLGVAFWIFLNLKRLGLGPW